ncbi:MAG: shikimate kinase [Chitinophagales bacterium]
MASGKSSLGKKIAKKLDRKFIDLDKEIELFEQTTINEIFDQKGEDYFRRIESEILGKTIDNNPENIVLALGGGTFFSKENIAILKENGSVVYLFLELKNILGRLKVDKENRPLVKNLEEEKLKEKISKLFKTRESFYEQAHLKVDACKSKSKLVEEVILFIENQK